LSLQPQRRGRRTRTRRLSFSETRRRKSFFSFFLSHERLTHSHRNSENSQPISSLASGAPHACFTLTDTHQPAADILKDRQTLTHVL
jgi:hypothetical protein